MLAALRSSSVPSAPLFKINKEVNKGVFMGYKEYLIMTVLILVVGFIIVNFIKYKKSSKKLTHGLLKEIDRLNRIQNFHICREGYIEDHYVKYILTELEGIKKSNRSDYRCIYGHDEPTNFPESHR
jgi:hypothetical protein